MLTAPIGSVSLRQVGAACCCDFLLVSGSDIFAVHDTNNPWRIPMASFVVPECAVVAVAVVHFSVFSLK